MNIRDIIKNEYGHKLNLNDKCAYCEKPWHNHKICWFIGGVGNTLEYLADDYRFDIKEVTYFHDNHQKYFLHKFPKPHFLHLFSNKPKHRLINLRSLSNLEDD